MSLSSKLIKTAKKIRKKQAFDGTRKRLTARAVANTEKNVLTKEQEQAAIDFWAPYIRITPELHNYYTEKSGEFHAEYVPDYVYYSYIDLYFNDATAANVMDNKCRYEKMFPGIKKPVMVTRREGGFWYDGASDRIISFEEAAKLADQENAVFVKEALGSLGGHGVTYICHEENTAAFAETFSKTIRAIKGDIVVQRPMIQHPDLAKVNDSSVNTVRVLSMLRPDGVKIYSSILRMGVKGAKVDNASSGGITCGIRPDGTCTEKGYYAYIGGGKCRTDHPTSGVPFKDIKVPSYDKILDLVRQAHPMVPHFRLVSWDIAVDETGDPVFIEANLYNGEIDFHQLDNGPLFGDDIKKILDEVFLGKM